MMFSVCYLIEPTDALKTRLLECKEPEVVEMLDRGIVWEEQEGDVTISFPDVGLTKVSLIFLAGLKQSLQDNDNLHSLFPEGLEISLDTFATYWSIERYVVDDDTVSVVVELDDEIIEELPQTGISWVDRWIGEIKEARRNNPD